MRLLTADYSFDTSLLVLDLSTSDNSLDFETTLSIRIVIEFDDYHDFIKQLEAKISTLNGISYTQSPAERKLELYNFILCYCTVNNHFKRFSFDFNLNT